MYSWTGEDVQPNSKDPDAFLLEYILSPDISIHNPQPEILPYDPDLSRLFYVPKFPASTALEPERDFITGEIVSFTEVTIQDAGSTSKNSMSLKRSPGPLSETTKGSPMNFPFWPGGFEETSLTNVQDTYDRTEDLKFENDLLSLPPGFDKGIIFDKPFRKLQENATGEPDRGPVNLLTSLEEAHELQGWLKEDMCSIAMDERDAGNIFKIEVSADDDSLLQNVLSPVLQISSADMKRTSQFAEVINVSQPVENFHEKIPDMAMKFPFELDVFQKQAILKLEERQHVLVAAHTSAGKTVVAEYAIALSQRHMTKSIYTSPIKALSNQKYRDFKETFKDVGLITGDLQIDPTASCLIMTTEILRSMLYCGSDNTRDLEYVIFDEVHYINDEERGHVWEEVLILLPDHVNIIMLSATVPNVFEFANWVGTTKKRKVYVICTLKRPVPLLHYLYVAREDKVRNNIYLTVDENGRFLDNNYNEACKVHEKNEKSFRAKMRKGITLSKTQLGEVQIDAATTTGCQFKQNRTSKKTKSLLLGIIDFLKTDDKLPAVIFNLSRKACDENLDILQSCDLTNFNEKAICDSLFRKWISKLKPEDQVIPQVIKIRKSLERGIGIHHSGILPILKEIVELLFQQGIVKLLFATETFAMGVNMPARTVVFSSHTKFDGYQHRNLETAEYIQMAGRAGRRGHDAFGHVILICKRDVPLSFEMRNMMLGQPMKLRSRFLLTYAMILTLLRVESVSVEDFMAYSFLEFDSKKRKDENQKKLISVQEKFTKMKALDENLRPLFELYNLAYDYIELSNSIMKKSPFLKEIRTGRVLFICQGDHYNKLGVTLAVLDKFTSFKVLVLDHQRNNEDMTPSQNIRGRLWHKMLSLLPNYQHFHPEGIGGHTVLKVEASEISKICKNSIKIEHEKILQNWETRLIPRFKNSAPSQPVLSAISQLNDLNNSYNSSASNIQTENLSARFDNADVADDFEQSNRIMKRMKEIFPYTNVSNFEEEFAQVYDRKNVEKQLEVLKFQSSPNSLQLYPDYQSKLNVLEELKYIDEYQAVKLKGRVARQMGQNELIITELVLRDIFTDLKAPEIAALLSSLVFQAQTEREYSVSPKLQECIKQMQEVDMHITEVERKHGIVNDGKSRLNFGLIEVVFKWAQNRPFAEIMSLTDIQEGIIVRCIQQLNETLRDVKSAAMTIGNPTLQNKMEEASNAIKRDIVFAASLYTTNF